MSVYPNNTVPQLYVMMYDGSSWSPPIVVSGAYAECSIVDYSVCYLSVHDAQSAKAASCYQPTGFGGLCWARRPFDIVGTPGELKCPSDNACLAPIVGSDGVITVARFPLGSTDP